MPDIVGSLKALIDTAETSGVRTPVRIRVTQFALTGSIAEVPVLDHDGKPTDQRELRITPEDWERLRDELPDDTGVFLTGLWGIPVVIDPAPDEDEDDE